MTRRDLDITIRDSIEDHMFGLRWWLKETEDVPLEEMSAFFRTRMDDYVPHMERWAGAYEIFPSYIDPSVRTILDLGCGSGLELDHIIPAFPETEITGIDMCSPMLIELSAKYPEVKAIEADYCSYPFEMQKYDAVISFESLHHLLPEAKTKLYRKIKSCLTDGGSFINCDYFACCEEEEGLLRETYERKRMKQSLPADMQVHFDIPLTLAHEAELLEKAGFTSCEALSSNAGAVFLKAF